MWLNKNLNTESIAGFTLVELMTVIAIMAVMSGAVTVGWHSFSDFIAAKNAVGNIEGVIDKIEEDHLRDEYTKSSVHFMEEYLLADSGSSGASLSLEWEPVPVADPDCEEGDIRLISSDEAVLFVSDPEGDFLSAPAPLYSGDKLCFNPLAFRKGTTVYQLWSDREFSNAVRIFPLNLEQDPANEVYLELNSYRLDILNDFGKKERYENNVLLSDGVTASIAVKVRDSDASAIFDLPEN